MKNDFPEYLTSFFSKYLVLQKGLSENTISSYSDAFLLFFTFYEEKHNLRPTRLTLNKITREAVTDFCQWLEETRGSSIKTRNLRLTAFHSFFRYVAKLDPSKLAICKDIIDIPLKKCEKKLPVHLSDVEVKMLFAEPNIRTKKGIRDLAIMTVLYDTGARVSELIDIKISDVALVGTATICVTGKGRKQRIVPISLATSNIIKAYYKSNRIDVKRGNCPLFTNSRKDALTRPGINYILDKYVQKARINNPDYFKVNVTAHVMRHTKATNLLLSDVSLIYIRDFLGHSSVITTEHYAKSNPEFLRKAIEQNAESYTDGEDHYSHEEKEQLIDFLKAFRV